MAEEVEFEYTVNNDDGGVLVEIRLKENFDPSKGDFKIDFIDPQSEDSNIVTLYSTIMRSRIALESDGKFWAKFVTCKEFSAHIKKVKVIVSRIQVETSIVSTEDEPPKKKSRKLKLVTGSWNKGILTGFGTGPWGGIK